MTNTFSLAKENIDTFLKEIIKKGFKRILLYGAGEVAEILVQAIKSDNKLPLEVLDIIDDDRSKIGQILISNVIISLDKIRDYNHDGILISSYTNSKEITQKLITAGYEQDKIINFFDE